MKKRIFQIKVSIIEKKMSVIVVGSLNVDLIAYTPHLPKPGETILGSKYEMGCGGKVRLGKFKSA